MSAKIHDETGLSSGAGRRRGGESVRLVNKDFRLVYKEDIPHNSIDLVLALSFPDPKIPEDEGGKIHEHLMGCAYPWLKEGVYWRCMSNNRYYQGSYAQDLLASSSSV
jgi:hypothetical protein